MIVRRKRRSRADYFKRPLRLEGLEQRLLMASDLDDSLSEATFLGSITTTAKSVSAAISPDTDVDMYGFTVAAGQVVDFDVDTALNGPGGLGSYLRLFDSLGQELASNNDGAAPGENSVGFDAYLRHTFATGGTYYVGISNANNFKYDQVTGEGDTAGGQNATGDYQLVVQALPVDTDDSLSEAAGLGTITTTPKSVDDNITTDIDVDMYRFTVTAGQVVDFDIDTALNGPGGLGSYLRLFDSAGQQLDFNNDGAAPGENTVGFDAYLRHTFATAGTFYVGISNFNNVQYDPITGNGDTAGGQFSIGSYKLTVQALPVDTDDSLSEATLLGAISTTPKTVDFGISTDIDVDMYRFTVTAGQVVDFDIDTALNGPGGLGSYLRLFNSAGQQLDFNNDGAAPGENTVGFDAYLRHTFATAGTFYVGISNFNNVQYDPLTGNGDAAGGPFSIGDYELTVQALPLDTDDSLSEATFLGAISTTADTIDDGISTDIDVDMYRFTVTAGQVVDFDIDTPLNGPGGLGSYLRLFDSGGHELAANNDAAAPGESTVGFDAYLRHTFAAAGTFYIGVSNFNNAQYDPVSGSGDTAGGQFSIGSYQLIVQAIQVGNPTLTESISPATISENGGAAVGTVTRSNSDIGQSLVVTLVSSDASAATVPATVTIAANQASVTFAVTAVDDTLLDGTQTATITASATGFTGSSRSIDVTDFETLTVTIDSTAISENGGSATGTVTRGNTDIGSALTVSLVSNDTTEASVPATVTIPANQTSTTFTITAVDDTLLDGTQTATITANAVGYVSGSRTINITDFETLTVSIGLASISENGGTATATVSRSNTNNTAPLTVLLSSSDTSEASVPGTIIIPAGQASATFTVTAVDDTVLDGTQTATITAGANGYLGDSHAIAVTDFETLTVMISTTSISENGGTTTGTVTRSNTNNSAALTVTLASSDTTEASVPVTVTIPANQASTTFPITAVDDTLLDGTQISSISASAAGYVSVSRTLSITDSESFTLAISPGSISENGGTATGTVTRSNTGDGTPLTVTLSSNDTTEATVPATVTIPAGQPSATFVVTGVDDPIGDGTQHVVVTATAAGFPSTTAGLDVTDDEVSLLLSLSGDLLSENGGTVVGTVSRITPNTSQPLVVTVLSSDTTAATVPATVTIPAGQASADLTITGVDDALSDGVQPAIITVSAPGFLPAAQTVLVADDERPYQNPRNALDVDGDQFVVAKDALSVINILNEIGSGPAAAIMAQYHGAPVFPDTNGDNFITAIDVLFIVNELNTPPSGQGEGEASTAQSPLSAASSVANPQLSPLLVDRVHSQTTAVTSLPSLPYAPENRAAGMNPGSPVVDLPRSSLSSPTRAEAKGSIDWDDFWAHLDFRKDDLAWASD